MKKFVLAFALLLPTAAQPASVVCDGVNDTVAIQTAVDAGDVELTGPCVVSGLPGIRVPSNRTIKFQGSTVTQTANVGGTGTAGRNRLFETVVGATNIKFIGPGTLVGQRAYVGGLQWSIGIRIDSASNVLIDNLVFQDWYTDGIYVGGNPPGSTNVTIRGVTITNSKRNAMSLVCGTKFRISDSVFETTNCTSDAVGGICSALELNMPMCGIDFEPNAGDAVSDVVLMGSKVRNNQKCGIFLQSNQFAGGDVLFYDNEITGNGTIGLVMNQVTSVYALKNSVTGGTICYSLGAGLHEPVFVNSECSANTGNAANFAGAWNPIVAKFKPGSRPVAYIAITSPVAMNGVAGDITIKPFE